MLQFYFMILTTRTQKPRVWDGGPLGLMDLPFAYPHQEIGKFAGNGYINCWKV